MGRTLWIILLAVGGGGLLVCLPLAIGGLEWIVNVGVAMQLRIIKGTDTFEIWRKPPVPIYLKVRVFNLTNPEDIGLGSKPILEEVGPFVYLETIEKVNIITNETSGTLQYQQIHYYYFQPQMSNGTDNDLITFINIPYVAVAKMGHDFTDVEFLLETLDQMLAGKGETLTRTHTVREFLFDGFTVQSFLDLLNDPMIEAAGEVHVPEIIKDGKMGLLKGVGASHKNGTSDGTWEVLSGKANSKDLTRIVTYEGKPAMTIWKDATCNAINGTDGMMFQPFLTKEIPLELFIGQLCRTMRYEYVGTVSHHDIQVYEYQMSDAIFQNVDKNPDNWCFCPEKNMSKCSVTGIIRLGPCVEGAPLAISRPHFLGADKFLQEGVVGLHPDAEKHAGYLYMHPKSGATLEARHRFQFNVQLQQWSAMPTFSNLTNVLLPLMWLEEGANIDDKNRGMLKALDVFLRIWSFAKWLLIIINLLCLLAGGFFLNQYNKGNQNVIIKGNMKPEIIVEDKDRIPITMSG